MFYSFCALSPYLAVFALVQKLKVLRKQMFMSGETGSLMSQRGRVQEQDVAFKTHLCILLHSRPPKKSSSSGFLKRYVL